MLAYFFPDHDFRGSNAPYLWIFYKTLLSLNEKVLFITGNGYINQQNKNRWEYLEDSQKRLGYNIPEKETIAQHKYAILPDGIYSAKDLVSGSDKFRSYIKDDIPELYQAIKDAMRDNDEDNIECIITWCNCATLRRYCADNNIKLIHMELGPLRAPEYLSTGYFDFKGVNGNTEAAQRFQDWLIQDQDELQQIKLPSLRQYFTKQKYAKKENSFFIGAALQVEDDSNVVAYSNGNNNQDVISFAHSLSEREYGSKNCIFRSHPGSIFLLNENKVIVDHSKSSRTFISSCNEVIAINSSVIFEAILQGKKTRVLGDSPFRFMSEIEPSTQEFTQAVFFFLFAYLVPFELLFDTDYIRSRLSSSSERMIIEKHFLQYESQRIAHTEQEANERSAPKDITTLLKILKQSVSDDFDIDYTDKNTDAVNDLQQKFNDLVKDHAITKNNIELLEAENKQLHKLYLQQGDELGYTISIVKLRDAEIQELNQRLVQKGEEVGHSISIVKLRDAEVQELNQKLVQKGEEHGYAISIVELRDAQIRELNTQLIEQSKKIQKLTQSINELFENSQVTHNRVKTLELDLYEKNKIIERLEQSRFGFLVKRYIAHLRK